MPGQHVYDSRYLIRFSWHTVVSTHQQGSMEGQSMCRWVVSSGSRLFQQDNVPGHTAKVRKWFQEHESVHLAFRDPRSL